ncbi:MAG: DUF4139 domain-containing protein [Bacteroidota bacterium]
MNYKSIILFLLITNAFSTFAQETVEINSQITDVVVFRQGAQVTSQAKTVLHAGVNHITVLGNPQNMVFASLQVNGVGNFTINSVKSRMDYSNNEKLNLKQQAIIAKRDSIDAQIRLQQVLMEATTEEESLLNSNLEIGGEQTGINILELKQIADYSSITLTQIKQKQQLIKEKIEKLNKARKLIELELNNKSETAKVFSVVDLVLTAPVQTNAVIELQYFTPDAQWVPLYDLRVNDLNGKINLAYKAQVFQYTGLEWNKVQLTLSTGNPSSNMQKPTVRKRFVDAYADVKRRRKVAYTKQDGAMGSVRGARVSSTNENQIIPEQNPTTVEFPIPIPYTIKNNDNATLLELNKFNFEASYEVYAAPEWDLSAYLTAQTYGWEGNGFEEGNMNIFLSGSFIGAINLDPSSINDTLVLSLGKDKSTIIEREKTVDYAKNKALTNNVEETYAYTLKVKNTRNNIVKIKVEEQIPIPREEEISVNITNKGDAKYDAETGILTWSLTLKPKEMITLKYGYSLKRPKDRKVEMVY